MTNNVVIVGNILYLINTANCTYYQAAASWHNIVNMNCSTLELLQYQVVQSTVMRLNQHQQIIDH